jgi:MFS family permease
MGSCFAALWTASEIWLNGVVDDRHRGRIIGASGALYATCQFLGPLVLGEVGVTGSLPLLVAMAPLAIGVLVALSISPARRQVDEEDGLGGPKSLRQALTVAGGLVAAAFLGGVGKTAMQSLLPIYGLAHGFDDAGAARLVAVFLLGAPVLLAGLGWLADRYGRGLTLRVCVLVATLSMLAIPFSVSSVLLFWPVLFVAGGTVAGVYTLGIVLIGQDFRGHKLAVVSTGFAMAYSAGSIVGSAPVGYLIDLFGPEALPLAVAIGFVGLSTYLFIGDDSEGRAGRESHPAVPNLKYLEDSQFEEDDTAAAERAEVEPEIVPASDADPFRPTIGMAAPRAERDLPLENFEEQMRRRRTEITEVVALRQKSRETQQNQPRPEPPKARPPPRPRQPANPFAPVPRSDDEDSRDN